MTSRKFEDSLDEWLLRQTDDSQPLQPENVPAELRSQANSAAKRQLLQDSVWLHKQMRDAAKPVAPEGFTDSVVAQAKESAPRRSAATAGRHSARWSWRSSMAWSAGLAATVALTLLFTRPTQESAPFEPRLASRAVTPDPSELDASLQDTTQAYLALARHVAESVQFNDSEEQQSDSTRTSANSVGSVEVAFAPPVRRFVQDSTNSLKTGSKGIETSIRPITESAVGAFEFLWVGMAQEKPST